jgi:hypothetical protein
MPILPSPATFLKLLVSLGIVIGHATCLTPSRNRAQTPSGVTSMSLNEQLKPKQPGVRLDAGIRMHTGSERISWIPTTRRPQKVLTLRGGGSTPPAEMVPAPDSRQNAIIGVGTWIAALHAGNDCRTFAFWHESKAWMKNKNPCV